MPLLDTGARAFGLDLTPAQLDRFELYYRQLVDWNARVNLTAITEYPQVLVKHFLDSLSAALALPQPFGVALAGKRLIDVGAGAGFPGMPLAIAFPQLHVTLLEATGKKAIFLDQLARALDLTNVVTLKGRAEELGQKGDYREEYDFATARAVAELRTLVEYTLPFVRVGGTFIAYKSIEVEQEIAAAGHAAAELGGRWGRTIPVHLPGTPETRYLVTVDKVSPSPIRYPRRTGVPEKKPL
ncbi:MAG: 16S rRNA (guanine(527)-N(7))-methyltransferase RsmG [Anaerolineae bacterium]